MARIDPAVLLLLAPMSLWPLGACRDSSDSQPAAQTQSSGTTATGRGTGSAAKRPSRHYWVINVDDRCFVYWTDGELRSVDAATRCPRTLRSGEKMRLAGKTCLRESTVPDRNVPIRCPKQIFYAERDDRAGEGEWNLPAAKAK